LDLSLLFHFVKQKPLAACQHSSNCLLKGHTMIFNFKTLITAALLSVGGTAAMAVCVDNCSSSNNAQQMLQVNGSSIIGGNVGSVFDSNYGSNEVFKDGETKVDIMSELGGFCEGDDCTGSKLNINLMAMEHGSAKTTAGTKQSGTDMSASNSGQFTSGTLAGINFGGLSTEVKTSGAAAFANAGGANATGKNVQTDIVSHDHPVYRFRRKVRSGRWYCQHGRIPVGDPLRQPVPAKHERLIRSYRAPSSHEEGAFSIDILF
jgi:hypothetical protein